jgi:hypothetical protein
MTNQKLDLNAGRGYELTKTGIVFSRALSDDEHAALGRKICQIANATAWAVGDWLVSGVGRGEDGNCYAPAQELTGRSYDTLSTYSRVSASYSHQERACGPWTFYREALRLPAEERVQVLRLAQQNAWNRSGLIDYINSRMDTRNRLETGAHDSLALTKRSTSVRQWRKAMTPKRDVTCPACGHRFDVRRKGLTEQPIEPTRKAAQA